MEQKRFFRTVGIAYFLLGAISIGISYLLSFVLKTLSPKIFYMSIMSWVISQGPMYLIGMPVCAKVMGRIKKRKLYTCSISFRKWCSILCMCLTIVFAGNIVGNIVSTVISNLTPLSLEFDLQQIMQSGNLGIVFLFSVILAPILEELIFRKLLIDRMIVFGDKAAILLSGFLFGLFHGNFYQLFYAFGIGCVLAYVYIRTGKIQYTISLHMAINFLGGFIGTVFLKKLDLGNMVTNNMGPGYNGVSISLNHLGLMFLYGLYVIFLVILAIIGLVKLIRDRKYLIFYPGQYSVSAGPMARYMFGNIGMWLFVGISVANFIMYMIPA